MGPVTCLCRYEGKCRGCHAVGLARSGPGMARVALSDERGRTCAWEEAEGKCLAQGVADGSPPPTSLIFYCHLYGMEGWGGAVILKVGNPHALPLQKERGRKGGLGQKGPPGRLEQEISPG